jgi:hypothetical protein
VHRRFDHGDLYNFATGCSVPVCDGGDNDDRRVPAAEESRARVEQRCVARAQRRRTQYASMNVGTITFRASPLLNDEQTQELFETNLQLAGLLPVRLEVVHNGGEAIEIKKLRLKLRDGGGTEWKLISAKSAISRILKANDIRLYNPNSRKTFEKEFRAYEFDLKTPFANNERKRQGLIIFQSPQKDPVASPRGLVLSIDGLAQPVTLNLN